MSKNIINLILKRIDQSFLRNSFALSKLSSSVRSGIHGPDADADRTSKNIPWIGRNHHQQNLEDLLGSVRISRTKVKVEADTVDQTDANYHFFNFRTSRLQWSYSLTQKIFLWPSRPKIFASVGSKVFLLSSIDLKF